MGDEMVDQGSPPAQTPDGQNHSTFAALKSRVDNVLWVIATAGTIAGFVNSAGGVVGFLMQVAGFTCACLLGLIPAILILGGIVWIFDSGFNRDISDRALCVLLCGLIVLAGWLIYRQGSTNYEDLNTAGKVFMSAIGLGTLVAPPLMLIYYKHSTPMS
ncbi:hypothetical protein ADK75_33290 [Streptomyces virginiae]|uniref:Uncharacterized protein n=1 Tax=Streptomyces virginiae TaxID=1961 RepID=A0A0L8M3X4_STRVG|nr:hypothetical protein [Streptomyces virginiae]KOG45044.1 hypothetical protein ADK75_33290 [Streptomyces virginiae]